MHLQGRFCETDIQYNKNDTFSKKMPQLTEKTKKTRAFHVQHYFRLCLFSSYLHLKIFVSKRGGSVYLETFLVQCLIIKTHTLMYIQEGFLKWGQTLYGQTLYLVKPDIRAASKFKAVHCEINFRSGI